MVPNHKVLQLVEVFLDVIQKKHQNFQLVNSGLRELENFSYTELGNPVNETDKGNHSHQLQQDRLLIPALNRLAQSNKTRKSDCTNHSLKGPFVAVCEDGLLDRKCQENNQEESGECDKEGLVDGREDGEGHSEKIEQ